MADKGTNAIIRTSSELMQRTTTDDQGVFKLGRLSGNV